MQTKLSIKDQIRQATSINEINDLVSKAEQFYRHDRMSRKTYNQILRLADEGRKALAD